MIIGKNLCLLFFVLSIIAGQIVSDMKIAQSYDVIAMQGSLGDASILADGMAKSLQSRVPFWYAAAFFFFLFILLKITQEKKIYDHGIGHRVVHLAGDENQQHKTKQQQRAGGDFWRLRDLSLLAGILPLLRRRLLGLLTCTTVFGHHTLRCTCEHSAATDCEMHEITKITAPSMPISEHGSLGESRIDALEQPETP